MFIAYHSNGIFIPFDFRIPQALVLERRWDFFIFLATIAC
jgi:hypothetical protein